MTKRYFIIIGIIIILALLIITSLVIRAPEREEAEEVPRKISPLASGKRTYELMTDNPQNFQIIKIEFDPLDAKQGESQQVTVWVEDTEDKPITSENKVEGIVFTDNKDVSFSLKLKEISDANGGTLAEWSGFWTLDDTYDKIYVININAKSADRECWADLTIR